MRDLSAVLWVLSVFVSGIPLTMVIAPVTILPKIVIVFVIVTPC